MNPDSRKKKGGRPRLSSQRVCRLRGKFAAQLRDEGMDFRDIGQVLKLTREEARRVEAKHRWRQQRLMSINFGIGKDAKDAEGGESEIGNWKFEIANMRTKAKAGGGAALIAAERRRASPRGKGLKC